MAFQFHDLGRRCQGLPRHLAVDAIEIQCAFACYIIYYVISYMIFYDMILYCNVIYDLRSSTGFGAVPGGSPELTEENLAILEAGDTVWPASVILGRYLCIQPPVLHLQGKQVLDLGCGLGIAGIVAAGLGAKEVLLQDRGLAKRMRQSLEALSVAPKLVSCFKRFAKELSRGNSLLRKVIPPA